MAIVGGLAALAGGALGGLSSAFGAQSQRDATRRMQEMVEQIRQQNLSTVDRESRLSAEQAYRQLAAARRDEAGALAGARSRAELAALQTFGSPMYQGLSSFVGNVMSGRLPQSIQDQVTGQFRNAQQARGLEGAAASRDESRAWGAYLFNQATQIAPLAHQLAMDPFEFVNRAQMAELGVRSGARQFGSAGLNQFLTTSQSAQQIAASRYGPILQSNQQALSQYPVSGASPLASGLAGLAQGIGGAGGLLAGALGGGGAGVQARPDVGRYTDEYLSPSPSSFFPDGNYAFNV